MNERKPPRSRGRPKPGEHAKNPAKRRDRHAPGETSIWLYGAHTVIEALANPRRRCRRLLLGPEATQRHGPRIDALLAARRASTRSLPRGAHAIPPKRRPSRPWRGETSPGI